MNSTVQAVIDASLPNKETFMQPQSRNAVVMLITMIISQIVVLFVGKYIWNIIIPSLFPYIKPAKTIWEIWGLQILIKLIVW